MKKIFQDLLYYIIFCLWWLVSILPLPVLYLFSSLCYCISYYVVRYRRKVVRKNLCNSFPEKTEKEIIAIEKEFYLYFCDLIAESIKFFSISESELKRRMQFKDLDRVNQSLESGRSIAMFLGHNCNWEWISSLPLWVDNDKSRSLQLYHPLENPIMDRLVGYERERMGSTNVPMKQSIRHIMKYRQEGLPVIVGFISDQVPGWESLNYWLPFFGQDTPVMTGGERIAQKMGMDCYYLRSRRVRRGYYEVTAELMTDEVKKVPEFWLTEEYYRRLEENIRQQPSYWLWTHRRWKRTRERFFEVMIEEERWTELENNRFCDHEHPEGKPVSEWAAEHGITLPQHP